MPSVEMGNTQSGTFRALLHKGSSLSPDDTEAILVLKSFIISLIYSNKNKSILSVIISNLETLLVNSHDHDSHTV